MDSYVYEVPLEEYLELRKSLDLNNVDRIDMGNVSKSGFIKIYYKNPQPINYKKQIHTLERYKA